jgi:TPR repeat protein
MRRPVALLLASLSLALAAPPALADASTRSAMLAGAVARLETGDAAGARRLLEPLAQDGSAVAETMLGGLYARGLGVPRDQPAAVAFWWRAAQRGYAPAQLALAQALAAGEGVAMAPEAALRWTLIAAQGGDDAVRAAADRLRIDLSRKVGARAASHASARAAAFRPWSPTEP